MFFSKREEQILWLSFCVSWLLIFKWKKVEKTIVKMTFCISQEKKKNRKRCFFIKIEGQFFPVVFNA